MEPNTKTHNCGYLLIFKDYTPPHKAPKLSGTRMLMRMVYKLSKGPDTQQVYHYSSKVKYPPFNHIITFEDTLFPLPHLL